jgi:hypothetical protein
MTTSKLQNPTVEVPPPNQRIVPNEFELLLSFFLNYWNRVVESDFKQDIDIDSVEARENWGNWSNEQQIKYICRIKNIDTAAMMLLRMSLFMFVRNGIIDPTEFFVNPVENWTRETVIRKPQVQLKFFEKLADQRLGNRGYPLRLVVSFRLNGKPNDYSYAELRTLVNKIENAFTPFKYYNKGREKYLYTDPENGYDFRLLLTKDDAKEIIQNVMGLNDHTPDWELLRLATKPDKNYANRDSAGIILGKQEYYPDFRPIGKVWLHSGQITMYPTKPFSLFRIKGDKFFNDVAKFANDVAKFAG